MMVYLVWRVKLNPPNETNQLTLIHFDWKGVVASVCRTITMMHLESGYWRVKNDPLSDSSWVVSTHLKNIGQNWISRVDRVENKKIFETTT